MTDNILQIVKDALTHMGCPLNVMNNIDANAPIVFNFTNGVVMNLVKAQDDLWLWSPIADYSDQLITEKGGEFLGLLMPSYPFFVTGKMHLANENGKLILQGLINPQSLEKPAYFATTLQIFFDMTSTLQATITE